MGNNRIMISWKMWQALTKPFVAHPLYQLRGVWRESVPINWRERLHIPKRLTNHIYRHEFLWSIGFVTFLVGFSLIFGPTPLLVLFFGIPLLFMFVVFPFILALIGTGFGLGCALMISDVIGKEKAEGRFTLLGLTPYGQAGATWALSSLTINHHIYIKNIREWITAIYTVIVTAIVFLFIFTVLILSASDNDNGLFVSLAIYAGGMAVVMDFYQSTNIGCLVGMIAPSLSEGRANTRNFAVGVFLTAQFSAYLLSAFFCFLLLPYFYSSMEWSLNGFYLLACLIIFASCREILTVALWVVLVRSLDSDFSELRDITGIGFGKRRVMHVSPRPLSSSSRRISKRN
jgi:hypothetical protein